MKKKDITETQARILVYLSVVHKTRKHPTAIASKLGINYAYVLLALKSMMDKEWLRNESFRRHRFYFLTDKAPLELAKNAFKSQDLEQSLLGTYAEEENYLLAKPEDTEPKGAFIPTLYSN